MSEYDSLIKEIEETPSTIVIKNEKKEEILPFSVEEFRDNISSSNGVSEKKFSKNINAYDISHECLKKSFFRITDSPFNKNLNNYWLPLELKSEIGIAIHKWMQTRFKRFSEKEVSLKVPSKNIYIKLDALIENEILVEIKTCSYKDYENILLYGNARNNDLEQAVMYKYVLENYITEIKENNDKIKYNKYNIKKIQLVYICNEILSSDGSFSEDLKIVDKVKNEFKSEGDLWFIKVITYNSDDIIEIEKNVENKINILNESIEKKKFLNKDFLRKEQCTKCIYNTFCDDFLKK